MIEPPSVELVMQVILFTFPIFIVAYSLYLVRVIKGPTIVDRVLAVDAFFFDVTVFVMALAAYFRLHILAPTAIIFALWGYALDVYVSKYIERGEMGD